MSPAISVVVCIYNVERYLRECLESIAEQSFSDFECILCDDESTDASGLIAQQFADTDPRFTYVRQQNRGPGPAGGRNGGIPHITGDRILFVDSDDVLLPDALQVMYQAAETTGSELVIGGVDRFNSSGRWPSFLHQRVHAEERLAVNATDFPDLVWDCTAWNKLISTPLWMEHIKMFDEGRLYEDLDPMIRLMCVANSIDVLADTVYLWRDRESKTSVTQQVASSRGLIDKVDQMLKLDRFLASNDHDVIKAAQDHKLLTADLVWMLDDLDRGSKDFHDAFWQEVPALVEATSPEIRSRLPKALREQYVAILAGDRDRLGNLRRDAGGDGFTPNAVRQVFATDDASRGSEAGALTELFGRATRVSSEGSNVVVDGFAALDRVRLRRGAGELTVWFEGWETGQRIEVPTELKFRPRLHITRQGPQLHRYSGFRAVLPAEQLVHQNVPVSNVMVGVQLITDHGPIGAGRLDLAPHLQWQHPQTIGSASIRAYRDYSGQLSLAVSRPEHAKAIDLIQGQLRVDTSIDDRDSDHGQPDYGQPPSGQDLRLFDPRLKRRWTASAAHPRDPISVVDLRGLPSGEYELQAIRTSREFDDGWVPVVSAAQGTFTDTYDGRVIRLHLAAATTFVEIANDESELRELEPSFRSNLDARLTELARSINHYTWI